MTPESDNGIRKPPIQGTAETICTRPEGVHPDATFPPRWEPKKPDSCSNFPINQANVDENPGCSYHFENGIRKGHCNQCGECCRTPYILLPEFGRKFRDESCPYLREEDGN